MTPEKLHGPGDVILDRYELVRLLGSGGWGRVYLANDRMLNRPVAIKQLLPRLAADPAAVSRFMREATVIASIREPHVLTVYDIAERDGQHYMVMEYADAGTLAQVLQLEGTLTPYEALSVAIDVCKGLRAVHSKGIVHRDVKPANVMFFSRGDSLPVAKIGDFGIALQLQEERLTPSDNVVGTLIYLSPEQASSSSVIAPVSDLYSLGVVLYEMMSGELQEPLVFNPLFANGDSSEVMEHLSMFPEPVRPLLIKALQRRPSDRFQSADEMLQALQRARSRLTVAFTTQAFSAVAPLELEQATKRRFPVRVIAVIAIVLAFLSGGAAATFGLVFGSGQLTSQPTPAPLVADLTSTQPPSPPPTPTATATATPTPTATLTPSATASPTPAPSATDTPQPTPLVSGTPSPALSPTKAIVVRTPTRVQGPVGLALQVHESENSPEGIYVAEPTSLAAAITYLEDKYLWGETVTRIGNTTFTFDRDAPDPQDPSQRLPPHLRLKIEYSPALLAAMQDAPKSPPGFDAVTGEFWVGRFRCGTAVGAASSPYQITVRLLDEGREIAAQQFVISVINNPNCKEGDTDSGGPPHVRP